MSEKAKIITLVALVVFVYFIYNYQDAKGGNLSHNEAFYEVLSEKLYKAMKGWGTDENSVYSAFSRLNTKADVLKLIQVFGVRGKRTLSEWLYHDLRKSEIARVNNILKQKGINYQF